jgi:hypothetical protein
MGMKKNLFKAWRKSPNGQKICPHTEAKDTFCAIYDMVMEYVNERLSVAYNDLTERIGKLEDLRRIESLDLKMLVKRKNEITAYMTELYDACFKYKTIDKNLFNSISHYMGEDMDALKSRIKSAEKRVSDYKRNIRLLKSLVSNVEPELDISDELEEYLFG